MICWADSVQRGCITTSEFGKASNKLFSNKIANRHLSLVPGVIHTSFYVFNFEVDAIYWTALVPDIVNSGREEQGSVSAQTSVGVLPPRETLENPATLRENDRLNAGVDRLHGRQAVRFW